eukprot:jgi/Mesvir1/17184/Mv07605-RA.1
MMFRYTDSLIILGISFLSACFCEAISWLLIYRTAEYKQLRSSIDKNSKKVESMKSAVTSVTDTKQKSKSRKLDRYETQLKDSNRDLGMTKMKSHMVVAVTLGVLYNFLSSSFDGQVMGRLPFEPFILIRSWTHRGLGGDDYRDCSMIFLYALCSMSIRSNLQKFLGFAPPKNSGNIWGLPPPGSKS